MITLNIHNETGKLRSVILGIGTSIGEPGKNNPKSKFHLENGTFPTETAIQKEIAQFEKVLADNNVTVYRPENINDQYQIFTRDIGFVIDDTFFISVIIDARKPEIDGISAVLEKIDPAKIIDLRGEADDIKIEGGDVIAWDDYLLVGKSMRTNDKGYEFLKKRFPEKKVIQIPVKSSNNHLENVLHLDCALQPVGSNHLILYRDGIENLQTIKAIIDILDDKNIPLENVIEVNQSQAYRMFPNVFSIAEDSVIIESKFVELKFKLKQHSFKVFEVDYAETSKLSGLFRCSTLPLERE